MPNHVDNELRVTGSIKDIAKFKAFAKEGDCLLSANKFIPYPKEFDEQDKKAKEQDEKRNRLIEELKGEKDAYEKALEKFPYIKDGYNSGGYSWCVKEWGTKWGCYDVKLEIDTNDELFYQFNSAWSPPEPLIKKMSKMFPDLNFELRYFECGMGFNGILEVEGGKVIQYLSGDYFGNRGG